MRLPDAAHTTQPWRIHAIAPDFELEDVWRLPTPGGPDDLPRLVELIAEESETSSPGSRALFALRWKLGELLGWDDPATGVGGRVRSLRERLPADLRDGPRGPDLRSVPARTEEAGPPVFSSLYLTHEEWVAEFANETVHALMHIGWVADDAGHHGQMAVLVKPNGWKGTAYMAAIRPFRLLLVYPALLRQMEGRWRAPDPARRVPVTDPAAAGRGHDYADAFELRLDGPDPCTPEAWLRAGFEATPAWIKWVAGSRDGVGSARVVESTGDVVVVEDSDPLMDTVLIGRNTGPGRRVLTTVLRYRRPRLARVFWSVVGILHRRTAPRVVAGGLAQP